jgi:hypothetical protein
MGRRKRYSAEFKRETLRRANEPDVSDVLVAEELGINARQLRRWRCPRPVPPEYLFGLTLSTFTPAESLCRTGHRLYPQRMFGPP